MKALHFFLILILICQVCIAQKKWGHKSGKYSEGGSAENRNHPLTTFDKTRSLNDNIDLIRENIKTEKFKYKSIYKRIYCKQVVESISTKCWLMVWWLKLGNW